MFAMATGKDIGNPEKNEQFFEVVNKSHTLQVGYLRGSSTIVASLFPHRD
jgi:hypothetical protein